MNAEADQVPTVLDTARQRLVESFMAFCADPDIEALGEAADQALRGLDAVIVRETEPAPSSQR
ncbi:hypothetical protein ACFO3J_08950 [Streptomyces polygonati]|uniref:Uncharacterized protein n=1 Tax=Streptomyces polygonati TaxID=1617087 RepID=A0ABV8HMS8_9ACTN